MEAKRVFTAAPYNYGLLNSGRGFTGMFVKQFQFPCTFDADSDHYESADNDVLAQKDCERHNDCFSRHTGSGELNFGSWVEDAPDELVLNFIKDILGVDSNLNWTGYRILVSRDVYNGYKIWTLEIFSKDPESNTTTYTGDKAPNVKRSRN